MKSANIVRYVFTGGFPQKGCPTASTRSSSKITRIKNFLFVFSFVVIFGLFFDIYPAKAVTLFKTSSPNSHTTNQQATIVYGIVKNFNFNTGKLILFVKNASQAETFYVPHSAKFYYKNCKSPESYEFLKRNLLWGTKVKIVVINGNEVKEIFIMEIPQ